VETIYTKLSPSEHTPSGALPGQQLQAPKPCAHPGLGDNPLWQHPAGLPPEAQTLPLPTIGPTPLPALHCPDPLAASPRGIAMGFSYLGFIIPQSMILIDQGWMTLMKNFSRTFEIAQNSMETIEFRFLFNLYGRLLCIHLNILNL
jgi:hypothetical protein